MRKHWDRRPEYGRMVRRPEGLTLIEQGPWGVIGQLPPPQTRQKPLSVIPSGCWQPETRLYSHPPAAKKVSNLAIDMVNRASVEVGGPENLATAVYEPSMEVSQVIFKHKDIPASGSHRRSRRSNHRSFLRKGGFGSRSRKPSGSGR